MRQAVSRRRVAEFVTLGKPRIVLMVLATTVVGFYLGSAGAVDWVRLLTTTIGTGLAAGGALALNQYLERDVDARMERTRLRPLPGGTLLPIDALVFGVSVAATGVLLLSLAVNIASGLVTGLTLVIYLLVYTPLKRSTPLSSIFGAIAGALPPIAGWLAARGELGVGAYILFAILFLWQMPHTMAIAWLYREDFARAGVRLLPIIAPHGHHTSWKVTLNCLALAAAGGLPTLLGVCGLTYLIVASVLGCVLVVSGVHLARSRTPGAARQLLYVTLCYLPVLLATMAFDRAWM